MATTRKLTFSPLTEIKLPDITKITPVEWKASRCIPITLAKSLAGTDVQPGWKYETISGECLIRDSETNKVILGYYPSVLNEDIIKGAIATLSGVAKLTPFRGVASGKADPENILRNVYGKSNVILQVKPNSSWAKIIRKSSGKSMEISNYSYSGNIGYYRHTNKISIRKPTPPPIQTIKFLSSLTSILKLKCPEIYELFNMNIPDDIRYGSNDIPFTTITINRNFQTAIHKDKGNFNGYALLTASHIGELFEGGKLVFPEYNLAVSLKQGDVLVANVGELYHGNEPFVFKEGSGRISFVVYARENLIRKSP